jgi:hypothetical protein
MILDANGQRLALGRVSAFGLRAGSSEKLRKLGEVREVRRSCGSWISPNVNRFQVFNFFQLP